MSELGWYLLYQPEHPEMLHWQREPGWYLVPESFEGWPDRTCSLGCYPGRKAALADADKDRMVVLNR
jgi:hypothetical protein